MQQVEVIEVRALLRLEENGLCCPFASVNLSIKIIKVPFRRFPVPRMLIRNKAMPKLLNSSGVSL